MRTTGPSREVVEQVVVRDRGCCLICDECVEDGQRGVDWHVHHRLPRKMGGSRRPDLNSAANLMTLCRRCHEQVESHRAEAYARGWLVAMFGDPARTGVLIGRESRWVYLTSSGEYSDEPPMDSPTGHGETWPGQEWRGAARLGKAGKN